MLDLIPILLIILIPVAVLVLNIVLRRLFPDSSVFGAISVSSHAIVTDNLIADKIAPLQPYTLEITTAKYQTLHL